MDWGIIGVVLGVIALFSPLITHIIKVNRNKKQMINDAKMLCHDIYVALTDYDPNNNEEEYDVELVLRSYFKDKRTELLVLANKLKEKNTSYLHTTDNNLQRAGELLIWIIQDLYDYEINEEEIRIHRWSSLTQDFFIKYNSVFDKKEVLNVHN